MAALQCIQLCTSVRACRTLLPKTVVGALRYAVQAKSIGKRRVRWLRQRLTLYIFGSIPIAADIYVISVLYIII